MPPPKQPTDHIPGESMRAYDAYVNYRDMGPERSLAAVGQKVGKSTTQMSRWSSRYRWLERVALHEEYLDQLRMSTAARIAERNAEELAREREQERRRKLDDGKRLAEVARQMLAFPLATRRVEVTDENGVATVTIVEPSKWRLADAARLQEVAAKEIAMALDEPTERVAVELRHEAEALAAELGLPLNDVLRLVPDAIRESSI